jgi:hypothetical protein
MYFVCRKCSAQLSNSLKEVDLSGRNKTEGEFYISRGQVVREDGSYFCGFPGAFITHPNDVIHVHVDLTRSGGCCGNDGSRGPNLQCESCKTHVATQIEECYVPHCVVFDPAAAVSKEGIST